MRRTVLLILIQPMLAPCFAQPFIDLFRVDHLASPGMLERSEVNLTLPLKLDTAGRMLLLDPLLVRWTSTTAATAYVPPAATDVVERMVGLVLPVGYITPLGRKGRSLTTLPIVRYNYVEDQERGAFQVAGLVLFSRKVRPGLTWRYGVYASNEVFGLFVRPLLGLDWRISERANLFGVLPGSFNYERRVSRRFRWGVSFRAYTNSYGTPDGDFRRIDENPLGLFGDLYFTKNLVLRGETGRTFIRQVRGGSLDPAWGGEGKEHNGYVDHGLRDSFYFRVVLAFRMRLDGT